MSSPRVKRANMCEKASAIMLLVRTVIQLLAPRLSLGSAWYRVAKDDSGKKGVARSPVSASKCVQ